MVESRTDEKTIICCGHSVQAEKTIITSTRNPRIVAARKLAREGVFHHILTPSANADHLDHFHFDIARESKNRFVR